VRKINIKVTIFVLLSYIIKNKVILKQTHDINNDGSVKSMNEMGYVHDVLWFSYCWDLCPFFYINSLFLKWEKSFSWIWSFQLEEGI